MLFFKRILTAAVLFVVLFIGFYIGALMVGGGIAGVMATKNIDHSQTTNFQEGYNTGYEVGHKAGAEFGKKYGSVILLGSFGVSAVLSLALPFCGAFPWCRDRAVPPPLN
jgi:hypothetical protein